MLDATPYGTERQQGQYEHELADLDAGVERQQGCEEFRPLESKLPKSAREAHAVQKAECEYQAHSPGLQLREEDVLDCDVGDRYRNDGLDDSCRHGQNAVHAQPERDGMREGEGADLPQDGTGAATLARRRAFPLARDAASFKGLKARCVCRGITGCA